MVIALPSKSTLYYNFSQSISQIKKNLTSVNISDRLSFLNEFYCIEEKIPIAISIDATVASSNPVCSTKIKNIFLIQLQPLYHIYKNMPFSILFSSSGQMNDSIKLKFEDVLTHLRDRFNIVFKCSDGDQGTNEWHIQKFELVYKIMTLDLSEIIKLISFNEWPISDFLHLIKNQRSRLFHNVSLTINSEIISLDVFHSYIPSKSFSDKSSLSKFSDKLALFTFSIDNIQKLMNIKKHSCLYYLLPFTLWGAAIRSQSLDLNSRKHLLEIAKFIFVKEYFYLEHKPPEFNENFTKDCERITFYQKNKLKRIINTLIGIYFALEFYPNNLALNRISTHPIENTFGITRSSMQNKIGVDIFISNLIQSILKTHLLNELNIVFPQCRKIVDAGTYLTGTENIQINCDVEKIKNEIHTLRMSISEGIDFDYCETNVKQLIDFLAKDSSLKCKEVTSNSVSGSGIPARNIASSGFK